MSGLSITIAPTDKVVDLEPHRPSLPVPARVWEGVTDRGVPVHLFVTRVVIRRDAPAAAVAALEAALGAEHPPPRNPDVAAYPARMVL